MDNAEYTQENAAVIYWWLHKTGDLLSDDLHAVSR